MSCLDTSEWIVGRSIDVHRVRVGLDLDSFDYVFVVGVALGLASPALALAQVCKGTLLQLQAQAPTKAAAMTLLNQQLDQCVAIP